MAKTPPKTPTPKKTPKAETELELPDPLIELGNLLSGKVYEGPTEEKAGSALNTEETSDDDEEPAETPTPRPGKAGGADAQQRVTIEHVFKRSGKKPPRPAAAAGGEEQGGEAEGK